MMRKTPTKMTDFLFHKRCDTNLLAHELEVVAKGNQNLSILSDSQVAVPDVWRQCYRKIECNLVPLEMSA